jgi:hypothetical protein
VIGAVETACNFGLLHHIQLYMVGEYLHDDLSLSSIHLSSVRIAKTHSLNLTHFSLHQLLVLHSSPFTNHIRPIDLVLALRKNPQLCKHSAAITYYKLHTLVAQPPHIVIILNLHHHPCGDKLTSTQGSSIFFIFPSTLVHNV